MKNSGGDVAANTVIEDAIPEGTEYVPGSMKILSGPKKGDITDEKGDDAGHHADGKVTFNIGDLPNTSDLADGITVQFKVKALSSHAGKTVTNKAQVTYKNLLKDVDENLETNEVTNNVIERSDVDACAAPVALINGSFEELAYSPDDPRTPTGPGWTGIQDEYIPGWHTTDSTGRFDIFVKSLMDKLPAGAPDKHEVIHGQQFAELNSFENANLYQDVQTTPGQTIYWRLAHKGRYGVDKMAVKIGSASIDPKNLPIVKEITTGKDKWVYYSGTYTVPAGQTVTRFGFEAISSATGDIRAGNFIDDIFLGTEPCVTAEKSVTPEGEVSVGDELTYEVTVKNGGGDIASNAVFEDAIPAGTEYVPGSLKITNGPGKGVLTDADDSDKGHFDGNKVIVKLGDLENTSTLPDGITVQFKVKALVSGAGSTAANKAQVKYKNLLKNENEETESNETKTPITYKDPVLESEKSATIQEKAKGNTDKDHPEVGDTLLYTIKTQNTVKDSLVKNMVISDEIPEGLEYVAGSLQVDGKSVTDEKDDDKGHYVDGKLSGQFGDIMDTEWHTITFEVKVKAGQAGADIKNVASVTGDNIPTPDKPEEEVKVYPREPVLESEKTAVNAQADKKTFEVGDTVIYTIKTRNKVSDGVAENLTITDKLPAGLEFIENSLEVSHNGTGTFENGTVKAAFGDVTDTEWHTVTFKAKILSGQVGKDILNIATATGSNVDKPNEPESKITVDPKAPKLQSEKAAEIKDKAAGNTDTEHPEVGDTLLYTIKSKNTVEDSLVKNLAITDTVPKGLAYVAGSLQVDGVSVTDAEGDDEGHVVDGNISGQFGDVTDTDWHTVTFEVKVEAGQAGADIKNVASVTGENITTPDEPEEVVKVYPREPVLESEKTAVNAQADKKVFEVGDTVIYTIKTRNKVSDGVVENLTITDKLPAGLEYIEGSLVVSHNGTGTFENGTVKAAFGDVTDTEWHTVTFKAKILSGQVGKEIQNTAKTTGDNVDKPGKPESKITVDPKAPKLESEKAAEIKEKAADNTDAEHPEVGDTLLYTIKTKNAVEDSLVKSLKISDKIPAGLKYVSGSLKVDGTSVTDEKDTDKGDYTDNTVTGNFGDIADTDWHTITFEVKVEAGQAGADIKNVASVTGDNITTPDQPEEEVKVYPRVPKLESEKTAVNAEKDKEKYEVGDTIVYTIKTRNTVSDSLVENLTITDELPEGLEYVEGSLEVSHNGQGEVKDGNIAATFGDVTDTESRTVTFEAKIKSGQSGKDIENTATVGGDNVDEPDKPKEKVTVDPKAPKLQSDKTAANADKDKEKYEVGDTIVYTIKTRNTVSDSLVKNMTITDKLPAGLEFVDGSLKVSHEGKGEFKDGTITAAFGDVTDTEWRTVTFEAKIKSGQSGKDIENTATVGGDNVDEPDKPDEKVTVDPKAPKLESDKTAVNAEKGKEKFEVGDTIVYTIKTRNTVSDSLVKNLTITDTLPAGLEYVAESLKVSHEGKGEFKDGAITATFGDVTDTEWRTVTFEAKINSGQSGKVIENTATVGGDNVDEPDKPNKKVTVDPMDPVLKSEKSAKLQEKAEGNKDKDHPEVGDTLLYTIRTQNTIEDSLVKNLMISDELPEGLEYVTGSLKVDGESVSDEEDEDKGHYVDGKLSGRFGDIKDTEWHTLEFLVKVKEGQASKDIINIATVDGDNIDDPDQPEEEVKVYPRIPTLESEKSAANTEIGKETYEVGDTIVYTIKARNKVSDSVVENLTITDILPAGLEYVTDSLKVSHEGNGDFKDGTITANFGDVNDTEWRTITFEAKIKSGQSGKAIENTAKVTGDNIDKPEEPEEKVTVNPKAPKLESEKTAANAEKGKEKLEVGDTIVYTIKMRNTVSDSLVKNLAITDTLPAGLEFVDGSLKVSHEGKGEFKDGTITAAFGDVTDTEWRTVTFEAKIKSGQSGKAIENTATVGGDNVDEPDKPEEKVTVDPKAPKLESEKTAANAEKGKEKLEVGDTIVYTIKTRNTVSDSLVKNLKITDTLPAGLEFVDGSLVVSHEGKGEFKDGTITAAFGDVTDTEWRTVTFEAKIKSGQSGKAIENTATVGGDNVNEPDEPEEKVTVDPKAPKLESEKTAANADKAKEKYEVGDTIDYTIKTRNTVSDSLVKNMTITDKLPAGLEFVDGSLKVSHEGKVEFKDGTITANFGDVIDTEWRTVTFEVKIKSGQSGKDIENVATVGGDNVDEPGEPGEKVTVDPKDPVLKSEKSAKLEAKAEGNTDKDHPEVGDTLLYTIRTQNTIADSLVENLVISDELPEGLEYVAGSLKVDGESVTDAKDNDKGHAVDGSIIGQFGDIKDTSWHTVEFLVKVKAGQAGKDIQNIAVVDGDNIDTPDKPREEVQIYPRHSVFESEKSAANAEKGKEKFEVGDTIVYTIKARNKVSDSVVENMTIADTLPAGLEYVADSLKVSHEGKGEVKDGTITATFGDVKDTEWRTVTFEAKIKSGQSGKAIENIATVGGDNVDDPDKPENKVTVDPKAPKLESDKSAENAEKGKEKYEVGDTIVYTIKARNTVSDSLVKNLSITDKLPAGLEYVTDSLKVSHEGKGEVKDGKITVAFGDVKDTEWRTVTFEAKIKSGQSGEAIENIATVGGENIDEPNKPENKVTVDPKAPKLEAEKSAANAEKGKEKFEVGDTIVYTIRARNTVSDSLVKNLTITDKLPEGLEYVADSLKVSHEGKGDFKDGKITAAFGDVKDTEWRTVTFKAKIQSGQFGETIKNIAEVSGDNVPAPNQPEAKIEVEPKDPEPTPEEPKDPTPAPDQDDDPGVKTPPSDTDKGDGKKLPNTATNLFNYGLIGIIAILAGLLALRRRKSSEK